MPIGSYTPSPSNKKDQAPSETLGLFLISGLSLAFSVGLSVALFFSLWLWGSLLRASFLIHSLSYYWGMGCTKNAQLNTKKNKLITTNTKLIFVLKIHPLYIYIYITP